MPSLLKMVCSMLALAAPEWVAAQSSVSVKTNPFDTLQVMQEGKSLFQIHCSYCHGVSGEGGRGPDLTSGKYRRGGTDAGLFATVRNGIPGTEMPAVRASDDEVWKMVAF